MIEYRPMKPDDIAAGLKLCREAKWNQLEREWQLFLQLSPNGCCVAINEGRVAGTVTTISYQHSFSWIGMVLVDAAFQRRGIGMQLLQEAMQILSEEETVKLDATPAGREVYLKLNFIDEYRLGRMSAIVVEDNLQVSGARLIREKELPTLVKFDHEIFGADRRLLLKWMWEGAPQFAFVVEEQNKIQGYCLGRQGHNFIHIGPVVAQNVDIAKSLVSSALFKCGGKPVIIDAMHFTKEWVNWLENIGFSEQRPFIRMYRGANRFPGMPEKQFAILGPEFG
ncbi:MAG: GNAT family N-acetyltransferase [Ginsengibacter sp.]